MIELLLAAPVVACVAAAPAVPAAQTPDAIAERFLNDLTGGESEAAYDRLFAGSAMSRKQTEVEQLAVQTNGYLKYYGKILGREKLAEAERGPYLMKQTWMTRHDNGPLIWTFYFFKKPTGWSVHAVFLNDQVANWFE